MQQLRNSCRYRYQRQKSLNEPVLLELFDIPIITSLPSLLDKLTNHPRMERLLRETNSYPRISFHRRHFSKSIEGGGRKISRAKMKTFNRPYQPIEIPLPAETFQKPNQTARGREREREVHPSFEENISHPSAAATFPPPPPPPNAARLGIVFPSTPIYSSGPGYLTTTVLACSCAPQPAYRPPYQLD